MDIVGAFACSHTGLMVTRRELAVAADSEPVFAAFADAAGQIAALDPDVVVIIGTDHMQAYTLAQLPAYTIGVGPVARGRGDAGIPACEVPVHQELAQHLLAGAVEGGFDLCYCEDVSIDHSFVCPLMLLTPGLDRPIVPLAVNCNYPPRPTLQRSVQLGQMLRTVLTAGPAGRAVLVGTGGLSHWVGSPERRAFIDQPAGTRLSELAEHPVTIDDTGPVNEEFDREFIGYLTEGRLAGFAEAWPADRIEAEAGNGAHELRNWLTVAAAAGFGPGEVLAYRAVPQWLTGIGVARFSLS
jgi:protocatechuate 4,5-dioxygenase beta chain/2'-carboxy-2,3-dihydroxybiphenyl 1,2-dioxygenase large subunit/2'-aminobiphenyl-2,3-diol 1,2-dioxygenase large subunit